ncbi:MAG TPA: 3-dehydroquinate synthase [Candidatus Sulfotelmatobacter sp.]|nr:3-dehydroquinate synthase [Candidatus Sulfotelmatobacter sp.]
MRSDRSRTIVLTGFMGSGKTAVGRRLAARLGYAFLDLDLLIEAETGLSIPEIFTARGEAGFRELEAAMVDRVAGRRDCVIATGGGAIVDSRNLEQLQAEGIVVTLQADPDTILARIGGGGDRPMLWGGDPRDRIRVLLAEREPAYRRADWVVASSGRSVDETVEEILARLRTPGAAAVLDKVPVRVAAPYEVLVGAGLLPQAAVLLAPLTLGPRMGLVTHPVLERLGYAEAVAAALRDAGRAVEIVRVPSGENSKSLERAGEVARALVRAGLDRGSALIALGGGVLGDLTGFVAAMLFRGIPFVSLPTTLLSQVDSSVGGKTGVNLPEGKNLLGVFHQPRLVVADVLTLATLSDREFRSGLAEVVKHAMIADGALFTWLEARAEALLRREADILRQVVAANCAIKARIVEADERENGVRALLNFGHTVGHALEAAGGYGALTHGEAVARGMLAAAAISVRRGMCPPEDAERLRALLARLGLLETPLPSLQGLQNYIIRDKKVRNGRVQFVLTGGVGTASLAPLSSPEELRAGLCALS